MVEQPFQPQTTPTSIKRKINRISNSHDFRMNGLINSEENRKKHPIKGKERIE